MRVCVKACGPGCGAVYTWGQVSMRGCAAVSSCECVHGICPGNVGCDPAAASSVQAAREIRHVLAGAGVTETTLSHWPLVHKM